MKRCSGILMPISSLEGEDGIGTLGKSAYKFADFLKEAGQSLWQILPLGHITEKGSPYECYSAFAGNIYLIDLEKLVEDNLLKKEELINKECNYNCEEIDYKVICKEKIEVLRMAYFRSKGKLENEINEFVKKNEYWIEDYALFMALKEEFNILWNEMDFKIKFRDKKTLKYYANILKDKVEFWKFCQYQFFKQWSELKSYVNSLGIKIIGDIPIYVSEDSVDVWAYSKNFKLDENKKPLAVSGCPPDAFSADGQYWGNPVYDWDNLEKDNYEWWINRIKQSSNMYDIMRLDHFKGFESYWAIPYESKKPNDGVWEKGPGLKFFNAIKRQLGNLDFIVEDLGNLTEEVINLKNEIGFPGMKILQFAFDSREKLDYMPHNYTKNSVVYTGTHDNDTIIGWCNREDAESDLEAAKEYLLLNKEEGYNWGFLRATWATVCIIAIAPIQDFLGLNNDFRINIPTDQDNSWKWRIKAGSLTKELAEKIYKLTKIYHRLGE